MDRNIFFLNPPIFFTTHYILSHLYCSHIYLNTESLGSVIVIVIITSQNLFEYVAHVISSGENRSTFLTQREGSKGAPGLPPLTQTCGESQELWMGPMALYKAATTKR